jgi:hypothetical protein
MRALEPVVVASQDRGMRTPAIVGAGSIKERPDRVKGGSSQARLAVIALRSSFGTIAAAWSGHAAVERYAGPACPARRAAADLKSAGAAHIWRDGSTSAGIHE